MKTKSAFTIVELLVVISIIAVLSTIAVVAYQGIQKDARDSTRKGNASIISEALEKYYDANGEYPSVASLVNTNPANTGSAVASKLKISPNDLKMPRMPAGATNSLTAGPTPHDDYITYVAKSDINDASCQNDSDGGCDQFTLQYIEESGTTKTIQSRHKGRADSTPTTPEAPAAPSVTVAVSGSNVIATVPDDPCGTPALTDMYAFAYATRNSGSGSWGSFQPYPYVWSTSNTYSIPGVSGKEYLFKAVTRCDNGSTQGFSSPETLASPITYP